VPYGVQTCSQYQAVAAAGSSKEPGNMQKLGSYAAGLGLTAAQLRDKLSSMAGNCYGQECVMLQQQQQQPRGSGVIVDEMYMQGDGEGDMMCSPLG
jgi:hypothetical protein